jgi:C1A family cysteine protease
MAKPKIHAELIDFRDKLGPARDQGQRPTCLAFAATAAHEKDRLEIDSSQIELSEEMLWWGCKLNTVTGSNGTSFSVIATALITWGQCRSTDWPYDRNRSDTGIDYAPPQKALAPGRCLRADTTIGVIDIEAIKQALRKGHAVVIGIILSDGFFAPTDGEIRMPESHEVLPDGHAVTLVGFQEGEAPGESYFVVRNSWGSGWGDAGHALLPQDYLITYGLAYCVVTSKQGRDL